MPQRGPLVVDDPARLPLGVAATWGAVDAVALKFRHNGVANRIISQPGQQPRITAKLGNGNG